jgi:hypothetical protein
LPGFPLRTRLALFFQIDSGKLLVPQGPLCCNTTKTTKLKCRPRLRPALLMRFSAEEREFPSPEHFFYHCASSSQSVRNICKHASGNFPKAQSGLQPIPSSPLVAGLVGCEGANTLPITATVPVKHKVRSGSWKCQCVSAVIKVGVYSLGWYLALLPGPRDPGWIVASDGSLIKGSTRSKSLRKQYLSAKLLLARFLPCEHQPILCSTIRRNPYPLPQVGRFAQYSNPRQQCFLSLRTDRQFTEDFC